MVATDPTFAQRWVLLPGTLCTPAVFAPLMQALGLDMARQITLHLDQPDVTTYRSRLAKTVRPGDVVCGFSLGAIAAAHAADVLPEAAIMVLIALNPYPDAAEKRPGREALRAAALSGALEDVFAVAAPRLFATPTPFLEQQVTEMARQVACHIDAQTALAISRPGVFPVLRQSRAPVILITGEVDQQTPPHLAQEAAQVAPKAVVQIVPRLGHFCLLEDPGAVAAAIRQGFERLGVEGC